MSTSPSGLRTAAPTEHAVPGRHRSDAPRATRGRRVRRSFIACLAAGAAVVSAVTVATTADARNPMYFGSVAGGYQNATAASGEDLANHTYSSFSSKPPVARMLTVHAGSNSWRQVANAAPGSQLHADIVRWADTIKARGGRVMVAYNHEPEAHDRHRLGSPADFIAAWRKVVTIFDQRGATNVEWTLQMTAYAFRVKPSDVRHIDRWYPGDAWVDNVGADAYNWNVCGEGSGKHNELSALGDPMLAFARAHGKKASFPEFASHANSTRAQWLRNAHQYLVRNQDIVTAAFYFNRPPTIAANGDCRWSLSTSAEWDAFGDIARDRSHFRP
jgi:Glycosyl hydrolase family 26